MISSLVRSPVRALGRALVLPRRAASLDAQARALFPQALGGAMLSVDRPAFRFQDLGATPGVGTNSEPLGLVLDQRLGGARGSDLFTQSPIDISSGWGLDNGSSGSGATASLPNTNSEVRRSLGTSAAGKVFELVITATGNGTLRFGVTNLNDQRQTLGYSTLTGAAATFTGLVTMNGSAGTAWFSIARDAGTATSVTLQSVRVREVVGTHEAQSLSGSRPIVVADGRNIACAQFDGADDNLSALASVDYSAAQVLAVAASFALTNANEGVIWRSTASATTAGTLTLIGNRGGVAGRIAAVYRGTGGTDRVLTLDAGATGTLITARAEADRTTGELRLNVNGVDAPALAVADLGTFAAGVPSLSASAAPIAMRLYAVDWIAAASLPRSNASLLSRWAAWKMGA